MVNGVSSVGTTNQNYQMNFKAKGVNNKKALEIIDKLGMQMPRDIELSKRPIEEQRETILSRFLSNLKIKDLFTGKVVKPGEAKPEHINAAIETANNASRAVYLEQLRKTNPEMYIEVLRRDGIHKVAQMSNIELLKEFFKGLFKKQPKDEYEKYIEKAVKDGVIDADHAGNLLKNHGIGKAIK